MNKNILSGLGWAMYLNCVVLVSSCSSKVDSHSYQKIEPASNCKAQLKKQEDSVLQKYYGFRSENDTIQIKNIFKNIRSLAGSGCATSEYELGMDLINEDNQEAISWLSASAQNGNSGAQFKLYHLYSEGEGKDDKGVKIEKDSTKAHVYFNQLFQKNYPPLLVEVADQKLHEALLLYQQVADSGNLKGIEFVAKAYTYGIGVEDELNAMFHKSYMYYSVAAMIAAPSGQCHDFLEKAQEYEKRLTKKEIERWRQMVQDWFEKHPNSKSLLKDGGKCL